MQGLVAAMAGLALLALLQVAGRAEPLAASHAAALAANFLVYRAAVRTYYRANPTAGPVVSTAALTLPSGYRAIEPWQNVRTGGGLVFVYGGADSYVLAAMERAQRSSGMSVGRVQNARLMSPAYGDLGIVVPATVPEGALAAVLLVP